ncbi:MAG: hypothetical protein H6557_11900 [Lewinellaceae bacterium]|nr:hypothetical protein [Phaeodactylibacter sp.]MCB9037312.1 hypothetical protein [Lewinellaceae bacterium]
MMKPYQNIPLRRARDRMIRLLFQNFPNEQAEQEKCFESVRQRIPYPLRDLPLAHKRQVPFDSNAAIYVLGGQEDTIYVLCDEYGVPVPPGPSGNPKGIGFDRIGFDFMVAPKGVPVPPGPSGNPRGIGFGRIEFDFMVAPKGVPVPPGPSGNLRGIGFGRIEFDFMVAPEGVPAPPGPSGNLRGIGFGRIEFDFMVAPEGSAEPLGPSPYLKGIGFGRIRFEFLVAAKGGLVLGVPVDLLDSYDPNSSAAIHDLQSFGIFPEKAATAINISYPGQIEIFRSNWQRLIKFSTPRIEKDTTYHILALQEVQTRTEVGASHLFAYLHQPVWLRVGLDVDLKTYFIAQLGTDKLSNEDRTITVNFNQQLLHIEILDFQEGIHYQVFELKEGARMERSGIVASGTQGSAENRRLRLEISGSFEEDATLVIRAFREKDHRNLNDPLLSADLELPLQVLVRPNPTVRFQLSNAPVPFSAEPELSIEAGDKIQDSVRYELYYLPLPLSYSYEREHAVYSPDGEWLNPDFLALVLDPVDAPNANLAGELDTNGVLITPAPPELSLKQDHLLLVKATKRTSIRLGLPEAASGELILRDPAGNVAWTTITAFKSGPNSLILPADLLPATTYSYTFDAGSFSTSGSITNNGCWLFLEPPLVALVEPDLDGPILRTELLENTLQIFVRHPQRRVAYQLRVRFGREVGPAMLPGADRGLGWEAHGRKFGMRLRETLPNTLQLPDLGAIFGDLRVAGLNQGKTELFSGNELMFVPLTPDTSKIYEVLLIKEYSGLTGFLSQIVAFSNDRWQAVSRGHLPVIRFIAQLPTDKLSPDLCTITIDYNQVERDNQPLLVEMLDSRKKAEDMYLRMQFHGAFKEDTTLLLHAIQDQDPLDGLPPLIGADKAHPMQVLVRPNPGISFSLDNARISFRAAPRISFPEKENLQVSVHYELYAVPLPPSYSYEQDRAVYLPDGSLQHSIFAPFFDDLKAKLSNEIETEAILIGDLYNMGAFTISPDLPLEEDHLILVKATKIENGEWLFLDQQFVALVEPDPIGPTLRIELTGKKLQVFVRNPQGRVGYQLREREGSEIGPAMVSGPDRGVAWEAHGRRFGMRLRDTPSDPPATPDGSAIFGDLKVAAPGQSKTELFPGDELEFTPFVPDQSKEYEVLLIKEYSGVEAVLREKVSFRGGAWQVVAWQM